LAKVIGAIVSGTESGLTTGAESETGMTSGAEKMTPMSREVEGLM